MDTKGRIGLSIAVIATVLSLVMAIAAMAQQAPPPSSNSAINACTLVLADPNLIVIKDRSFTTPSNCAAHGNLNTNAIMNSLCDSAITTWASKARGKCEAVKPPLPCKVTASTWYVLPSKTTRTCEEDPGHFSKLICTVTNNVICDTPGDCAHFCEILKGNCISSCGKDNAACKQGCEQNGQACLKEMCGKGL